MYDMSCNIFVKYNLFGLEKKDPNVYNYDIILKVQSSHGFSMAFVLLKPPPSHTDVLRASQDLEATKEDTTAT